MHGMLLRPFRRILISLALALVTVFPAHALWQQDKFIIGSWGGPQPMNGCALDTTQMGLIYRAAAANHLNLVITPPTVDRSWELKTASALGVKVMFQCTLNAFEPITRPPGLTDQQWAGFIGYRIPHDEYGAPPTPATRAIVAQYHAADPTKVLYSNELNYYTILDWMDEVPEERFDAWSYETYIPLSYPPNYVLDDHMVRATGPAPHWSLAYVDGEGYAFPDPDDPSLRAMAFLPVAYGARGIIWSQWASEFEDTRARINDTHGRDTGTRAGYLTTKRFWKLATINHYLRDVVGPGVMGCDFRYVIHSRYSTSTDDLPWVPNQARFLPSADKPFFHQEADIPYKVAVSIWQPKAGSLEPPGTYYLLVVNTRLVQNSGILQLRGPGQFNVGAAPSVVGYKAGTSYSPVSVEYTTGGSGETITRFPISLEGGEGRMYKVVPASETTDFGALTYPLGGESWEAGESRVISWTGAASSIQVRLYTDAPRVDAPEGPYVSLTSSPITGSSYTFTVPAVSTTRGRIEVIGNTSAGASIQLTHNAPITIKGIGLQFSTTSSSIGATSGCAFAALTPAGSAEAKVVFVGDPLQAKVWSSANGSVEIIPDKSEDVFGTAPQGWFGLSPSVIQDAAGTLHVAYQSLYQDNVSPDPEISTKSQVIRYMAKTGETWTSETVAHVGTVLPGLAMAMDPGGQPYIAYNSGSDGNYYVRLKHRHADGTWSDCGIVGPRPGRDIKIAIDSDGTVWVASVAFNNTLAVHMGGDDGTPYGLTSVMNTQNVVGSVALHIAADGVPEVVYVQNGTTPGSHKLTFQRVEWNGNTYGSAPEYVDTQTMGISGLALSRDATNTFVAYSCNGVMREAKRGVGGTWTRYDLDLTHDASGPVGFAITSDQHRWYSFWDQKADMMRYLHFTPDGGGGGCGAPCVIEAAIDYRGSNPVQIEEGLSFGLRFARQTTVEVTLFDVAGRIAASRPDAVYPPGERRMHWKLSGIQAGVYFLRVRLNGHEAMKRRVVFVR